MIEFLKVLGVMLIAGLTAAGALVAFGVWHRNRHRWNAIDEVRPPDSEGHTGALRLFYKGTRILNAEFDEVASHRSPR